MPGDAVAGRPQPRGLFLLASAVLAADQITKHLVAATLEPGQAIPVLPGWFQIRLIVNRGGLFGVLRDLPDPWRALLFSGIPLLASLGLVVFLLRTSPAQSLLRGGLALILGGAIGNLTDRLRLGHVVDFVDVFFRDHHWPAFNLADSAICVGVGLILWDAFRTGPSASAVPAAATEAADPSRADGQRA